MRVVLIFLCLMTAHTAWAADLFSAAGRLENATSQGSCSATLIADDIVATAAHCIREDNATQFVFRLGNGQAGAPIPVVRAIRHPFYTDFEGQRLRQLRFDVAVARLEHPVSEAQAVPMKLGDPAQVGEGLFLVSWRAGEGSRPRQRRCLVIEGEVPGVVVMGCRVRGGESGAPVTRLTPDGVELVAIISSRSQQGRQPIAVASDVIQRIPPLLHRLGETP
ncbi:MAG: trypsin-like serine protease [Silicimonas sp.]|nr:trypsin-like serine protease [Silicimonas sp.]